MPVSVYVVQNIYTAAHVCLNATTCVRFDIMKTNKKCWPICSPSFSFLAVFTFYWSFIPIFCSVLQLWKEWPHLQGLQGAQEGERAGLLQLWQGWPRGPRLRPCQRAEVLLLWWIWTHTERLWEGQVLQVDVMIQVVRLNKSSFIRGVFYTAVLVVSVLSLFSPRFSGFLPCVCMCRCGEIGHVAVQCSKASEVNCYNCGKSGHLAKECTIEATA